MHDHHRVFVILNPTAGRGAAGRAIDSLLEELDRAGVEGRVERTKRRGHAIDLAEAAVRDGWGAVVAAGGDGTVNEVVNGLMAAAGDGPSVPLGIIPVGSGNDFAGLVGVPLDPREAVRLLLKAQPRAIDVGRVGDRWFTNGVGVGLDARVAIEAARVRRLRGMAIYVWALARILRRFRPPHMQVYLDGEREVDRRMTLVTIGNGARHGGGFWICPDAKVDDGLLDVCMCDELSRLGVLSFLPRVLRGTHVGASCVHMHRVKHVRVTSKDPLPVHTDGEILAEAAHEVVVEIHPGRLRVLV
jgi:diacylglycerol kinase (ATP)